MFIFAIHLKNSLAWVLCSVSTAGTILIRPTSIFLILIYLIILAFLLVNSHKKREILCFSLPFIAVLFLLSVYNYLTVGHFTFSGLYSEHALISFTSTFLQEKPTYPQQVNEIIKKCYRRIGAKYKGVLEEDSWDHKKLNRVLRRYYNRNRNFIFESLSAGENKDEYALYLKWRPMLGDMAWTAIKKKPGLYLKYVYSNLLFYFFHNWRDFDFYERLAGMYGKSLRQNRTYQKMFSDKESGGWGLRLYYKKDYGDTISPRFSESFLKELSHPQPLAGFKKVVKEGEKQFVVKPTLLQRVHTIYKKIHDLLFRNILWTFIFLFQLIFSFFLLLKSRFHHKGALIMFVMTLSALGHGFIICMSSFAILRYSYTLEFVYYLSLFLVPIVTRREKI